jgi:hypothetical protein
MGFRDTFEDLIGTSVTKILQYQTILLAHVFQMVKQSLPFIVAQSLHKA